MGGVPTPESPPPPPSKNTRRHPRFEMYASVELHSAKESMILPARNISLGGVYLSADGHDLGGFPVGAEIDVMVFDALDEAHRPVRLRAAVMRHDDDGMALMWTSSESNAALELARLLDSMQMMEKTTSS
jgi:hypothetical protein